jgi:hypothetical protein
LTEDANKRRSGGASSAWRGRVVNEADRLDALLTVCDPPPEVRAAAAARIAAAREAARTHLRRDWFTGVSFDRAWSSLQAAEELLIVYMPARDLKAVTPDLIAELESRLTSEDPRLAKYRKELETCGQPNPEELTPAQRSQIRAARHTANTAAYVAQGVVRRWRNLLLAVGAAIFFVAVLVAILDLAVPDFLPLEDPSGGSNQVWEVELMGALGGAIGAVFAINRFSGYTDPNGLPLYQALLRIPVAAAVALLGVLLLQNNVIDALKPQSADAVLAYAVVFGYAQEPLLRMVDRKAGEVLGPARGRDDPQSKAATPAAT